MPKEPTALVELVDLLHGNQPLGGEKTLVRFNTGQRTYVDIEPIPDGVLVHAVGTSCAKVLVVRPRVANEVEILILDRE